MQRLASSGPFRSLTIASLVAPARQSRTNQSLRQKGGEKSRRRLIGLPRVGRGADVVRILPRVRNGRNVVFDAIAAANVGC